MDVIISFKHGMTAAVVACSALLGGCVTDTYGYGPSGYYDGGYYGGGYYGGIDYGYGPAYGWYGDFYYPGSGIYVYDRGGRRSRWTDDQRRYWSDRVARARQGGRRDFPRDHRRDGVVPNNPGDNGAVPREGRFPRGRPDFRQGRPQGQPGFVNPRAGDANASRPGNAPPPRFNRPNPNPGGRDPGNTRSWRREARPSRDQR